MDHHGWIYSHPSADLVATKWLSTIYKATNHLHTRQVGLEDREHFFQASRSRAQWTCSISIKVWLIPCEFQPDKRWYRPFISVESGELLLVVGRSLREKYEVCTYEHIKRASYIPIVCEVLSLKRVFVVKNVYTDIVSGTHAICSITSPIDINCTGGLGSNMPYGPYTYKFRIQVPAIDIFTLTSTTNRTQVLMLLLASITSARPLVTSIYWSRRFRRYPHDT